MDLSPLHRQAHMVGGQQAAKALDQAFDLKKAHRALLARRSASAARPWGAYRAVTINTAPNGMCQ
ncbi:hypothetical protein D3C72_2433150 [compost metagenome]